MTMTKTQNDQEKLQNLKQFIENYSVFANGHVQQRLNSFTYRFRLLSNELESIKERAIQIEKCHATRFNLFKLLQVERNEVYTHSAFLADLLSPTGTHGQGSLFLESFFELLSKLEPKNSDLNELHRASFQNPKSWRIEKEKNTAFGRLDLVIFSAEQKILIVIENKIDAIEQKDQLKRYENWLSNQQDRYQTQLLCFLTKDGYDSQTSAKGNYIKLSYRKEVATWLEEIRPRVEAAPVSEAMKQYIAVVKEL